MKLPKSAMEEFMESWQKFDKDATCFMETKFLKHLVMDLRAYNDDNPIGFKDYKAWCERSGHSCPADGKPPPNEVTARLMQLAVVDRLGRIAFHDVLEAIGKRAFYDEASPNGIELPAGSEAEKALREKYTDVLRETGIHNTEVSQYSSTMVFMVIRMQSAFRRRKAFKNKYPTEAAKAAKEAKMVAPSGKAVGNAFVQKGRTAVSAPKPVPPSVTRPAPKSTPLKGR
jgi:hypothetical protein